MICQRLTVSLLVMVVAASASIAAELPDRRAVAGRPATDTTSRNTLLDLLRQLEELQTEVRQLRNNVEVQGHDLSQLKDRQRALYEDLDARLRDAERRGSTKVETPPVAPTTTSNTSTTRITTAQQQKQYDAAFELMKQGLYDRAIKAFRAFLVQHPDSGLADNAQYWIAEGNYVLRNYKLALEEFTKVVNDPQSSKGPDALLKIGYVQYELGAYDKARKTLVEVQERYAGTGVARLAAVRLDKMKKEGR